MIESTLPRTSGPRAASAGFFGENAKIWNMCELCTDSLGKPPGKPAGSMRKTANIAKPPPEAFATDLPVSQPCGGVLGTDKWVTHPTVCGSIALGLTVFRGGILSTALESVHVRVPATEIEPIS